MNAAKIQLSEEELQLVQNAGWLLTKNTIMGKVVQLFSDVAGRLQAEAGNWLLLPEIQQSSPKISKGEQYEGLPYVVLDYPRLFGRENLFAVRTMFWWGHFFSVTLHLKGSYKACYQPQLLKQLPLLAAHDFYICIAADEWQHHFSPHNYTPLRKLSPVQVENILSATGFCKLAVKVPLQQWNVAGQTLHQLHGVIVTTLAG